jgi:hypothetical protein
MPSEQEKPVREKREKRQREKRQRERQHALRPYVTPTLVLLGTVDELQARKEPLMTFRNSRPR